MRIYRRYLQFEPEGVEEYIDFLLSIDRFSEAGTHPGAPTQD